jgi:hypothetical protein
VPPQWEAISDALTYFVVKTHPAPAAHQQYPLLDVAYLAGVVLESAGVTPDDYFAANIRLRERCDGRFLECKEPGVLESFYAEIFDHQGVFER